MKKLISRFTMKCKYYNFTDIVSGRKVFNYIDKTKK